MLGRPSEDAKVLFLASAEDEFEILELESELGPRADFWSFSRMDPALESRIAHRRNRRAAFRTRMKTTDRKMKIIKRCLQRHRRPRQ